jgi:hypothetical protein
MSTIGEPAYDDRQLVRYLLRLLPEEEAERLDEMSIADDGMAWRLRLVEDDLVDAYASGTLTGETLERFESSYLSSERRRQKARFAESLRAVASRKAVAAGTDDRPGPTPGLEPSQATASMRLASSYGRIVLRGRATWGLAAAAALLMLAGGGLWLRDLRLTHGLSEAQQESAALGRRAQDLERQLEGQRAANAEAVRELERFRAATAAAAAAATSDAAGGPAFRQGSGPASMAFTTIAIVLLPQTRGVAPVAVLEMPRGTDRVRFDLRLESNRFPGYQVALKDPAVNQIVWRSGRLAAASLGGEPTLAVVVPARLLKSQHYALELLGAGAPGSSQVVGSYAVRIDRP